MSLASLSSSLLSNLGGVAAVTDADQVVNIAAGAQNGLGVNLVNIDSATPQVFLPTYGIVTRAPTMFYQFDGMVDILKALIEQHPKEVSGIDFNVTLETTDVTAGHDGQTLHVPTVSKRSAITPQFTWNEIVGNVVWNFHYNWIKMIRDPDTQFSLLSAINGGDTAIDPVLLSTFTMDVLWIQFDPTMQPQNIIDAYYSTCMFPTETSNFGWKRTISHGEVPERSIAYTGLIQHNYNTKVAGQIIADRLGLHRVNYNLATPVASDIPDELADMGIQAQQEDAEANYYAMG